MPREVSAGGVVVREREGVFEVAAIRPRGKKVWALPKGHVDPGETPEITAAREVREETGLTATLVGKLGDVRYVYQWKGERIFKLVSFFLFTYAEGTINVIDEKMRVEVDEAAWLPLSQSEKMLAYKGEKDMAKKAQELLAQAKTSAT